MPLLDLTGVLTDAVCSWLPSALQRRRKETKRKVKINPKLDDVEYQERKMRGQKVTMKK